MLYTKILSRKYLLVSFKEMFSSLNLVDFVNWECICHFVIETLSTHSSDRLDIYCCRFNLVVPIVFQLIL